MTEALQKYLHLRPNSPNYLVRLPVPSHLQELVGRREITKSMKTSDRRIAEKNAIRFIANELAKFEQYTDNAESIVPVDLNSNIVSTYYDEALAKLEELMRKAALPSVKEFEDWISKKKIEQKELKRLLLVKDYRRMEVTASKFILKHKFPVKLVGDQYQTLLGRIMESFVEAFDVMIRRAEGEINSQPRSDYVVQAKSDKSSTAKEGHRIADFFPKYMAEQNEEYGRNLSNLKQSLAVINTFAEWIGRDRDISLITRKEAAAFRDVISKIPSGRGRSNKFSGLSLNDCIVLSDKHDLPRLSPATKARYISDLSSFFKWLVKRGESSENIWQGMNFKFNKEKGKRPSYTVGQLNILLSSSLYSGFLCDKKEHVPGKETAGDWRHWVPLLCMFTGARITEIAQLYVDDIADMDGRLVGYIKANEERGQSVKTDTTRLIVFHSVLLSAGFRDYWQKQLKRSIVDRNQQLFPELIAKGRPELGTKPAKWFRTYLTRIGIKKGADGLGSHSFRHTLSDEMRKAGYMNAEFGLLVMGHADRSMTARYGETPQGTVGRLHEMIEAAKFEGVDFSKIIAGNGNK